MPSSVRGLAALALCAVLAAAQHSFLFHGTSVLIHPNASTHQPGDGDFAAANFFSYATPAGYLSFGWWLPAAHATEHEHCVAAPKAYDWFEVARGPCSPAGCRVRCVNYASAAPHAPAFEEDYVIRLLDVGNGDAGRLALSYFDRLHGAFAVGSSQMLSFAPADADECDAAFGSMVRLQKEHELDLPFDLVNPCFGKHGLAEAQKPVRELR